MMERTKEHFSTPKKEQGKTYLENARKKIIEMEREIRAADACASKNKDFAKSLSAVDLSRPKVKIAAKRTVDDRVVDYLTDQSEILMLLQQRDDFIRCVKRRIVSCVESKDEQTILISKYVYGLDNGALQNTFLMSRSSVYRLHEKVMDEFCTNFSQ